MGKSHIENAIDFAARGFAVQIINAIRAATLQELIDLQGTFGSDVTAPKLKLGREAKVKPAGEVVAAGPKKRVVLNYPKCAFPGCDKNRFVRGQGFCGDHWRMREASEIEAAEHYRAQESEVVVARKNKKRATKKKNVR